MTNHGTEKGPAGEIADTMACTYSAHPTPIKGDGLWVFGLDPEKVLASGGVWGKPFCSRLTPLQAVQIDCVLCRASLKSQ